MAASAGCILCSRLLQSGERRNLGKVFQQCAVNTERICYQGVPGGEGIYDSAQHHHRKEWYFFCADLALLG